MNKLKQSVKKLSPIFDVLIGVNITTAREKVMSEYPCTRYMH
jgi:hypothetical protein